MLSDQWASFREQPRARLLCWQLRAAERSLFDAFIELESDERTAEHATLFVTLDTPFVAGSSHGRSLSATFERGTAQGEGELSAAGLPHGWQLPTAQKHEPDQAYLVRCCESFLSFFEVSGEIALTLRPREVADVASYEQWLMQLAAAVPGRVRIIVLDDAATPVFTQLAAAGAERIVCQRADLDVPGALIELSDAAGNLATPGGKFRDLFLRMGNALQADDLEGAVRYADAAVEVSRTHALWHLAVPVHCALAAVLLARGCEKEGLARYAEAEAAAQCGSEQADPTLAGLCKKLYLQSRLAHAAGLAGLQRYGEAAASFEQTVPLAAVEGDDAIILDCHRLASFCHEQAGDLERAWQTALLGLSHARELEPNAREYGNFASLAEGLRRMAAGRPERSAKPVLEQLARLSEPNHQAADHASASAPA